METDQIRDALLRRYAAVADRPVGQFPYPVGRGSVERLGYAADLVARIPPDIVDHFVGVGNPFSLGEPQAGWRVVDEGCGAGFDSQIAAQYVGSTGQVVGVDMSPEMLAVARSGLAAGGPENVTFIEGRAEAMPVDSDWADLVISNGVLNLATCKSGAFAEIARVLRAGGWFQAADLILVKELPEELRNDEFAWSN
jgi:arsenite methyltransferase